MVGMRSSYLSSVSRLHARCAGYWFKSSFRLVFCYFALSPSSMKFWVKCTPFLMLESTMWLIGAISAMFSVSVATAILLCTYSDSVKVLWATETLVCFYFISYSHFQKIKECFRRWRHMDCATVDNIINKQLIKNNVTGRFTEFIDSFGSYCSRNQLLT